MLIQQWPGLKGCLLSGQLPIPLILCVIQSTDSLLFGDCTSQEKFKPIFGRSCSPILLGVCARVHACVRVCVCVCVCAVKVGLTSHYCRSDVTPQERVHVLRTFCITHSGAPTPCSHCMPLVTACSTLRQPPCVVLCLLSCHHNCSLSVCPLPQDQWPPALPSPLPKDEEPICVEASAEGHRSEAQPRTGEVQRGEALTAWWAGVYWRVLCAQWL